jgi:heterodisulfide reductase subunit C
MTVALSELDTKFKYDVANEPGGENVKVCFACGLCTASCPVADIDEKFNPRRIIRMGKEVLSSDTIWFCIQCYNCQGHCPQNVDFADIVKALRSMAVREGYVAPSFVEKIKEIDVFCQKLRHEMVNAIVDSRSQGTEAEPSGLAKEALQRL